MKKNKFEGLVEVDPDNINNTGTDWNAVRTLTDDQITKAAEGDPDNPIVTEDFWKNAKVVMPTGNKTNITIRIDSDVLGFFKKGGKGYQKRINAVLRSYYESESARSPQT